MIAKRIVWKMALANMGLSWKQTALTVMAGAIGAMLITISYVNYASVSYSGKAWLDRHFGTVNWELAPSAESGIEMFTSNEVKQIIEEYKPLPAKPELLPIVSGEAALVRIDGAGEPGGALPGVHVMGFNTADAINLDEGNRALWSAGLSDDEAIIDKETAGLAGLQEGDALKLQSVSGNTILAQVKRIVESTGLTGYRGSDASASGTVIVSEAAARKLNGLLEGYDRMLAGGRSDVRDVNGMTVPSNAADMFMTNTVKSNALNKVDHMKNQFAVISFISAIAVASSALFMRQVLIMIADARREIFGVMRALGLSQRHIRSIFGAEAMLLSVFSAVMGTAIGTCGGALAVKLFYGAFADELARMSGANIPIAPHVPLFGTLVMFAIIVLFLTAVAMFVARAAGKARIIDALRGGSDRFSQANRMGKNRHMRSIVPLGIAVAIAALHGSQLIAKPPEPTGGNVLFILLSWLAACVAVIYIALKLAGSATGIIAPIARGLRMPQVSVLLASKFSRQHPSRSFTIALLFALIMMTLTFTANLSLLVMQNNDVNKTNQTMLGFGGYASYNTQVERMRIANVLSENVEVRSIVKADVIVEPYMLLTKEKGMGQAFVPVISEMLAGGGLQLRERASRFASDQEAWAAVQNDPKYIILPLDYLYPDPDRAAFDPQVLVKAGETIELPIYKDKLRMANEQWEPVDRQAFVVAGFAENNSEADMQTYLFRTTYVNPYVYEKLKPYGFKWPDQHEEGFVLMQYDYRNVVQTQRLEELMLINGITTFHSPYADNRAEQLINMQITRGFIGFTVLSALIGLFGLAIVQYRAVGERAKTVAMLRCVGLSGKHISRMFMLEGSIISIVGLLAGWAIGSTGANIFVRTLSQDVRPGDQPALVQYPFEIVVPMLLLLLAAAIVINVGPARGALRRTPAEALRTASQ